MEDTDKVHEKELKERKHRNWLKADFGIKYLRDGLEQFVDDVVKKQHALIMSEYKGKKCKQCTFQNLRSSHLKDLYNKCPLSQKDCICFDTKNWNRRPCRKKVCGSVYDKILQLYFFYPPTPCWKNTDIKKWCDDPWAIAKCFISFPGYLTKAGPKEIDCTGLLHILINNVGLHHHLQCTISLNGTDVFCRVRRMREAVIRNPKHELDDTELNRYFDDMIEILHDKKELCFRQESQKAVQNILELKDHDFVLTPTRSIRSRNNSEAEPDNTDSSNLTENETLKAAEGLSSYNSKYVSEYIHQKVLGRGAFGVVFEAINKLDKLPYAIKRITLRKSGTLEDKVSREVRALANFDHPNIVRYFHAWPESPPPGWQEQKDQQLELSESQNTLTYSSDMNTVSSASRITDSFVTSSNPQNNGCINDKKGIADMIQNQFDQTFNSPEYAYEHSVGSSTWDCMHITDKSREKDQAEGSLRQESRIIMPPLPNNSRRFLRNSQEDQEKKMMEKENSVQHSTKDTRKGKLFFYIQMQLCKPETLAQWLEENTLDREKQKVLDWFMQILSAVSYVHDKGFLHRDLKPSNIFFSLGNVVKVGDFGFATSLDEDQEMEIYSEAGTYLYMSPEILNKSGKIKSNKVDIYSLGVILFELLYSFHTLSERVITLEKLKKLQFPENFTREMPHKKKLVSQMLANNPDERPTAKEIHNQIMFEEKTNNTRRKSV